LALGFLPFGGADADGEDRHAPRARDVEIEPGRRPGHSRGGEADRVAPSTLREMFRRFETSGLTWPLPLDLADAELEARLYGEAGTKQGHRRRAEPDWAALTRFLGRIELDTNTVERAMRPLALTRTNSLFAGSEGGAEHGAVLASLIATRKLSDVEPQAYVEDVITKLINGHLQSRLDELPPWAYAPRPVAAAA